MTEHADHGAEGAHRGGATVRLLESLDNIAHIVVAVIFILMATTVIIHMGFIFGQQLSLVVPEHRDSHNATVVAPAVGHPPAAAQVPAAVRPPGAAEAAEPEDPFVENSLELLSLVLFVVILLELLRTIITYLQTHNIQVIMQEFLVVGIISCVRKLLLVGAQSSLVGGNGMDFVLEATGVVIDIVGILLLIGALVILKRACGTEKTVPDHKG